MELGLNPALARLKNSRSVLLAGAGGGFEVFAGLPILFWLEKQGVEVTLANLTFANLEYDGSEQLRLRAVVGEKPREVLVAAYLVVCARVQAWQQAFARTQ